MNTSEPNAQAWHAFLLLFKNTERAICSRLIEDYLNQAKLNAPIQLALPNGATHWDEVHAIARIWGGASEIEYDRALNHVGHSLFEAVMSLPIHEQAALALRYPSDALTYEICDHLTRSQEGLPAHVMVEVVDHLIEDLMEHEKTFFFNDYQATEVEKLWDRIDALELTHKQVTRLARDFAEHIAPELRHRLTQQLQTQTQSMESFGIATSENGATYWDEIVQMSRIGSSHLLHETLIETLTRDVIRHISQLSVTEQYALWCDTQYGADCLSECETACIGEQPDRTGLEEAAKIVVNDLLYLARD